MLKPIVESPRQLWWVAGSASAVFGIVVVVVTLTLRVDLRDQLLQRDVEVLSAVSAMLAENVLLEYVSLELEADPRTVAAEAAILSASVEGVLAVSIHTATGGFIWGAPETLLPAPIDGDARVVRYYPELPLADVFNTNALDETLPLVEARAPVLVAGEPMVFRYWLDGEPTQRAFRAMDRRLARQASGAWLAGCALLLGLSWLQQRAIRLRQEQLARRTQELEDANRDLDFTAKNTALGAVAASLVHDLRNPLNVLRQSMASAEADDVATARSAAEKMEAIILEVVEIMRDQDNVRAAPYEWGDIEAALAAAFPGESRLECTGEAPPLSGQQGGLLILILKQLVGNALRVSPPEAPVTVQAQAGLDRLSVRVADQAGGIAPPVRESLFRPVREAARVGSGLGLALARQFSRSLGGDLALERSSSAGSVFLVSIPLNKHHSHAIPETITHSHSMLGR